MTEAFARVDVVVSAALDHGVHEGVVGSRTLAADVADYLSMVKPEKWSLMSLSLNPTFLIPHRP